MTGRDPMDGVIRPVRQSDAADLQRNCFPDQSLSAVEDYVTWCLAQANKERMVRLVTEVDGEIVASGQLAIHQREGEIGSLQVAPRYRKRGLGNALLGALLHEARIRDLHVVEIMADASVPWLRAWYERRGFVYQGERALARRERVAYMRLTLSKTGEE
jgi:ribosomal protein S18 acetylase RimI-like enzyme